MALDTSGWELWQGSKNASHLEKNLTAQLSQSDRTGDLPTSSTPRRVPKY